MKGALARRDARDSNYMRFLAFNDLIDLERGMRAEADKGTPLTVLYRNRDMIQGLVGGKCRNCGTRAVPARAATASNPNCNALDSQDDHRFRRPRGARCMSYTADALTYSPDPPALLRHDRSSTRAAA